VARHQIVTEKELNTIDKFVVGVLNAYKEGKISEMDAKLDIGHVLVAIDQGNADGYTNWVETWLEQHK